MSSEKRKVEKKLIRLKKQREELLLVLDGREEIHPNERGCLERLEEKIAEAKAKAEFNGWAY